jgi:prephenate dehydratase
LLARPDDAIELSRANKALVAFDLPHTPGSLANALQALSERDVNLTKIESRPIAGKPFEYRFVVELTAVDGPTLTKAVEHTKTVTPWLRVLGAYTTPPAEKD